MLKNKYIKKILSRAVSRLHTCAMYVSNAPIRKLRKYVCVHPVNSRERERKNLEILVLEPFSNDGKILSWKTFGVLFGFILICLITALTFSPPLPLSSSSSSSSILIPCTCFY